MSSSFGRSTTHDARTRGSKGAFLNDARLGRLPQVSWVITSFARGLDEHPPADITVGMGIQEELITAVRQSPQWPSSAFLLTYDEHGGYFDHVAPPQIDAFGLGVRVPLWVISPFAKKGPIETSLPAEHTSTLKFLERLHGLPTLASQNHLFDAATPTGGDYETGGAPAPPRDAVATSATCSTVSTSECVRRAALLGPSAAGCQERLRLSHCRRRWYARSS